jgi:hypothetical protein
MTAPFSHGKSHSGMTHLHKIKPAAPLGAAGPLASSVEGYAMNRVVPPRFTNNSAFSFPVLCSACSNSATLCTG